MKRTVRSWIWPGSTLVEVATLFLRLGSLAFGGPAAHIALMEAEVVRRRGWLTHQHFLDLLGATNLIPGPNSTEMAIHLGYVRAGKPGLITAGIAFITPAVLIVLALAWVYVRVGTLPQATWLLYGVKPVIIAIVAQALWQLGKTALKGPLTAVAGIMVVVGYFLRLSEVLLLFMAGLLVMALENVPYRWSRGTVLSLALPLLAVPVGLTTSGTILGSTAVPVTLGKLFFFFFKVGSILFGSGYVLLAFLRADLVGRWGWLSEQQLLDAIAIGQLTPGPLLTTATFIGYVVAGFPGAILATVGIFLPAFFFVLLSNPFIPRLRTSPWASSFLDGVNVASLGLMAAVTWQLGRAAVVDWATAILALFAGVLVFRGGINSAWLVLGGAVVGWGLKGLTGA